MFKELNLSLVEGNLTRDPEIFYTKTGASVCKYDVAVNHYFKSADKEYKDVSYISINCFNKLADVCYQYLKKGSRVRVKGRIKMDKWQSAEGTTKTKLNIQAASVDFLGSPKKKETETVEKSFIEADYENATF